MKLRFESKSTDKVREQQILEMSEKWLADIHANPEKWGKDFTFVVTCSNGKKEMVTFSTTGACWGNWAPCAECKECKVARQCKKSPPNKEITMLVKSQPCILVAMSPALLQPEGTVTPVEEMRL